MAIHFQQIQDTRSELNKVSRANYLFTDILIVINDFLSYILKEHIKDDKFSLGLFSIPAFYKRAKLFINDLIEVLPQNKIHALTQTGFPILDIVTEYLRWCILNIIVDNKVKIPLLKIIPFIIRTYEFVRGLVEHFKK